MNNKLKKIVALCLAFAMVATVVLPESAYAKTKKTAKLRNTGIRAATGRKTHWCNTDK